MIPEKGSSNNNLFVDLPDPSNPIENDYAYNFYGHDKTDNSKLESDQSSEVDVNDGTKKEEDKPASDEGNPQSDEDKSKSEGNEYLTALKMMWNLRLIGGEIPDNISLDINIGSAFVRGASLNYTINVLTRGDAGVYFTRTEQNRAGAEFDIGINLNVSNYTGNPLEINKNTLLGPVKSVSGGWGLGVNGFFGYPDTKTNSPSWVGFGAGVGLTYGGAYGWGTTYSGWF